MQFSKKVQLISLESLMVPRSLGPFGKAQAARRLATLLAIGTEDNKQGGTGKATKVFNCFGEPLCLKSIARISRMDKSERELQQAFYARAVAFRGEYSCQAMLQGIPGIAQPCGYGTYAGGPIILMEWVRGMPLRKVLQLGKTDVPACAAMGAQVAATLLAARVRDPDFVHRDISGRNILVLTDKTPLDVQTRSRRFETCLIDFGSALCGSVTEGESRSDGSAIWRNATPEYAPPEMLTHSDARLLPRRGSEKVDVYELCSVLWELYFGSTPYMLTKARPKNYCRHKLENEPIQSRRPRHADDDFRDLLLAGLASDQGSRPTLGALWEALVSRCAAYDTTLAQDLRDRLALLCSCASRHAPKGNTIVRG